MWVWLLHTVAAERRIGLAAGHMVAAEEAHHTAVAEEDPVRVAVADSPGVVRNHLAGVGSLGEVMGREEVLHILDSGEAGIHNRAVVEEELHSLVAEDKVSVLGEDNDLKEAADSLAGPVEGIGLGAAAGSLVEASLSMYVSRHVIDGSVAQSHELVEDHHIGGTRHVVVDRTWSQASQAGSMIVVRLIEGVE